MSTIATKSISAEELFAMGYIGRCELIRGEIIQMVPAGAEHGDVTVEITWRIKTFVAANSLGKVYAAETGFIIARNPDTVRAPDVAFVRQARVPASVRRGFFEGPPDLAVEVLSPNDVHSEVMAKVDQWLASVAISVWLVDPPNCSIEVYHSPSKVERFRQNDELHDEAVLRGFVLRIGDVFR
jgi:Uma2 family endonuclease